MTNSSELKRLSFVQSNACLAVTEAEKLYKQLRGLAPQFVVAPLQQVEDRVSAVSAPFVQRAVDTADSLLKAADAGVDTLVLSAELRLSQGKAAAQDLTATASTASAAYLAMVHKAADVLVEKLSVKGVQAATLKAVESSRDALHAAVQTARAAAPTDPDAAVKLAADAWTQFAALPAIAKLLTTAEPATKLGMQALTTIHDRVVAAPAYARAVQTTTGTLCYAATTTPYRLGAQYVYPLVSPYADPALRSVSGSKAVQQAVEYWRPTAPATIAAH